MEAAAALALARGASLELGVRALHGICDNLMLSFLTVVIAQVKGHSEEDPRKVVCFAVSTNHVTGL